jgi:hypothetical protein
MRMDDSSLPIHPVEHEIENGAQAHRSGELCDSRDRLLDRIAEAKLQARMLDVSRQQWIIRWAWGDDRWQSNMIEMQVGALTKDL